MVNTIIIALNELIQKKEVNKEQIMKGMKKKISVQVCFPMLTFG